MNLNQSLENLQKIAKERTVKTQNLEYDLDSIVKRIDKKSINLSPDYQRKYRWDEETSSKLIESLILNIPIPAIYLSLDIDADDENIENISRYSVIDGQQRLQSIYHFFKNKLVLNGLEILTDLNGLNYKKLPDFLMRRLEDRTLQFIRIDSTIDPQVKFDIFERLNSGSVELSPQELRNAVYGGYFNDLLKDTASNITFRKLISVYDEDEEAMMKSKKIKKMEDVEIVLRFLSFKDSLEEYTKLKPYLSECMGKFTKLNESEQLKLQNDFYETMNIIYEGFGENAFCKYTLDDNNVIIKTKSYFNLSVFDALSVGVYRNKVNGTLLINDTTINNYKKLFNDEKFVNSVTGSTMDKSKINYRIEKVMEVLK